MPTNVSVLAVRWYLRGNAACEAAIAKGARPMFLTLVFPDVGYEFAETEEVEAFESLKEALFGAKLAACRLEIAKSMKANPDSYGLDYDPDAVAEQRAASWIAVNARSEFQKRYGKPAIRFKKGSRLQGFIFKKEHVEALSKMSGAFLSRRVMANSLYGSVNRREKRL